MVLKHVTIAEVKAIETDREVRIQVLSPLTDGTERVYLDHADGKPLVVGAVVPHHMLTFAARVAPEGIIVNVPKHFDDANNLRQTVRYFQYVTAPEQCQILDDRNYQAHYGHLLASNE